MPVQPCRIDGKPGYRWGDSGACYGYDAGDADSRAAAKQKAINQGLAIMGGDLAEAATLARPRHEEAAGVDLPGHVVSALRRGLALVEAGRGGSGLRPGTIRAARAGVRTGRWSEEKVVKASAWFARHAGDRKPGWDDRGKETPGFVAWCLWGDNGNGKGRASIDRLANRVKKGREMFMPLTEAVALEPGETLGDFREALCKQFDAWLRQWLEPMEYEDGEWEGYGWWPDDMGEDFLVACIHSEDVRGFLKVDFSRAGQVFTFSNPVEVLRRTSYVDLDEALRVLPPVGGEVSAEEAVFASLFRLALSE